MSVLSERMLRSVNSRRSMACGRALSFCQIGTVCQRPFPESIISNLATSLLVVRMTKKVGVTQATSRNLTVDVHLLCGGWRHYVVATSCAERGEKGAAGPVAAASLQQTRLLMALWNRVWCVPHKRLQISPCPSQFVAPSLP